MYLKQGLLCFWTDIYIFFCYISDSPQNHGEKMMTKTAMSFLSHTCLFGTLNSTTVNMICGNNENEDEMDNFFQGQTSSEQSF